MAQLNTKIVLRNDSTEAWSNVSESAVLLKGEVGIEFLADGTPKMKIGDGTSTWAQLDYVGGSQANVLEVTPQVKEDGETKETHTEAINRVATGKSLNVGDVAYVKELICEGKYSYTGYVYNGNAWAAMDGNYSADNVYFDQDMMVTKEIGYITLTNGSGTIPSAGKNLTQVFEAMFVKEDQPTVTDPSVNLTASNNKEYEVGDSVTPTYSVSLNAGSYKYGPDTGVTERATDATDTGWEITATGVTGTKTAKSGSFDAITVADNTNYKITAKVYHTAGATPLTNKGNVSTKSPIAEGTKSKTSAAITGYRKFFYGPVSKDITALTSEDIRSLTDGGKYKAQTIEIKANGVDTYKAFVIAIPDGTTSSITEAKSTAGMVVDITDSYNLSDTKVAVADKRGGAVTKDGDTFTSNNNPKEYKLYVWSPASIGGGVVHSITLG